MEQVTAKLSRLPVSGFKVRLIADQIRGKQVGEALEILKFSKKASAKNVNKLLDSAIDSSPIQLLVRATFFPINSLNLAATGVNLIFSFT